MYLWDTNILRYFVEAQPTLRLYLEHIPWREIALPSVVVAEVLLGRCEFALKATPSQAPDAHRLLQETRRLLDRFPMILFDETCADVMRNLQQRHKTHKRYADLMIAAMIKAGKHILVTRNQKDFAMLLPKTQLVNWIDDEPQS